MRMAPSRSAAAAVVLGLGLAGCSGWQSALDPHGPHAARIASIIFTFTIVCTVVWLAVIAFMVWALMRRRPPRPDPLATPIGRDRRTGYVIVSLAFLTGVVVAALTLLSFVSQRSLYARAADTLALRVIGHQWWWEIRYEDPAPSRGFTTANEIRIPVGRTVTVALESTDVIHSFWIPSLAGKMDNITGVKNTLQLVAERPGIYRGQCAEFCGWQHAHMAVLVRAVPPDEFEAWYEAQLSSAAEPTEADEKRGREVFLSHSCVLCHRIGGTPAGGTFGPDLTHVAGRLTIAAGVLPMSRQTLMAWIANPQQIKPGANMPVTPLEPQELEALGAYLSALR
jgi:cytochrome c oxidase subunit 2